MTAFGAVIYVGSKGIEPEKISSMPNVVKYGGSSLRIVCFNLPHPWYIDPNRLQQQ